MPCIYLANIKDILLCIKDTNTPHIFNCHLFKKDKAICSFFFSPTRGILTTSMLMFCVMVGRQSNPQMQAFPPFLVAKGVSKLDTSTECGEEQCQVWGLSISSAIEEVPSSKHGNEQTPNRHQHTHGSRLGICLFPCVPACSASRLPLGLLQCQPTLERRCPMFPPAGAAPALRGGETFLLSEHTRGNATAPAPPRPDKQIHRKRLRPIGGDPAPSLPGSPIYL